MRPGQITSIKNLNKLAQQMHKDRIEHNCIWLWNFSELFALLIRTELSCLPAQRKEVNDSKSNKQLSEVLFDTVCRSLYSNQWSLAFLSSFSGDSTLFWQPQGDNASNLLVLKNFTILLFLLKSHKKGAVEWKAEKYLKKLHTVYKRRVPGISIGTSEKLQILP